MKIAIFHNYLDNIGGAEIVALRLARLYKASLYTTNIDREKIIKMGFEDVLDNIISIGKIPKNAPFRQQLALYKFRKLNLGSSYDLYIIAGDWAMSGGVNNRPNIWYAHSPLNELWEFRSFVKKELLSIWKIPFYNIWVNINRRLSLSYSKSIDYWVANSENTKKRIKRYYLKEAKVVHPPTEINNSSTLLNDDLFLKKIGLTKNSYWLSVNRLTASKRIEMQYDAFAKLKDKRLVIVGSYEKGVSQFEEYIKKINYHKPDNVLVLSWVDNEDLQALYRNCQGFITTSVNEDFGMTVVEAMAFGKPVIAPKDGGYIETVNDKTGILIEDINSEKLAQSIYTIEKNLNYNTNYYIENCVKRAKRFNLEAFKSGIDEIIYNDILDE